MNEYKEISDFICGTLIVIDYDVPFEKIMTDFFKEENEVYLADFSKEVKKTLSDINEGKVIPMKQILDRSNFSFDEEGLEELCIDILEAYKKREHSL